MRRTDKFLEGQSGSKLIENHIASLRLEALTIGESHLSREIAYLLRRAQKNPPGVETSKAGLFWLNGFKSEMNGVKASYVDLYAASQGQACLRFDYSGHGKSGGLFERARIGDWLAESLHMFLNCTEGPQIVIGSSMGGWLALLMARALGAAREISRLKGMILIAPATDFTETLLWEKLSPEGQEILLSTGHLLRPTDYNTEPYYISRGLIEEGRKHLLLGQEIRTFCPIHILQGMADREVPWQHALTLVEHIAGDPVTLCLIKDGDHRLSRPEDLAKLQDAIEALS